LYNHYNSFVYPFLCCGVTSDIRTEADCQSTKAVLKKQFKLKSTKDIVYLGIKISCKPDGTLQMLQEHYVNTLLDHFNVGQMRERCVPIAQGVAEALLSEAMKSLSILGHKKHTLYWSIVGKLMYAMVGTWFDIAFCVDLLERYSAVPTSHHLRMAEHTLVYLQHTFKMILEYYRKSGLLSLKSYVDLDWASSERCKSTSGMVHLLNDSVIAWSSKKQATITLSTGEAEYVAARKCTREVVYLRQLLSKLDYPQHTLIHIHKDNQTCISFIRDDTTHSHTKHIDVKYHFTWFQIDESMITLVDTRTEDQLVDLFMK
jgi:hypothetical protein